MLQGSPHWMTNRSRLYFLWNLEGIKIWGDPIGAGYIFNMIVNVGPNTTMNVDLNMRTNLSMNMTTIISINRIHGGYFQSDFTWFLIWFHVVLYDLILFWDAFYYNYSYNCYNYYDNDYHYYHYFGGGASFFNSPIFFWIVTFGFNAFPDYSRLAGNSDYHRFCQLSRFFEYWSLAGI